MIENNTKNNTDPPDRMKRTGLPVQTGKNRGYANGDVDCIGWQDRIDICVCMVRNLRQPEKCKGCSHG